MTEKEYISNKIPVLIKGGYKRDQAYTIAKSMYEDRRKENGGRQLPKFQPGGLNYPNMGMVSTPFLPAQQGLYAGFNAGLGSSLSAPPSSEQQTNQNIGPTQEELAQWKQQELLNEQAFANDLAKQYGIEYNTSFKDRISEIQNRPTDDEAYDDMLASEAAKINTDSGNYTPIPQPPNYQTFNPYGGVDIPTAAAYLGTSIESGNTLGAIGSGLKVGLGIARNAFGAAGQQRRNEVIQDEYNQQLRDYATQANNPQYYQDGGVARIPEPPKLTPYQNGGEKIDQSKLMTGEFLTGVSNNNTAVEPNAEVEDSEYILTPEGDSMKVIGDTHEQGGEEVQLQEGDMVISDHLKLKGQNAKRLREEYDINIKAKNTYAEAVDKIYNKIGLSKLIKKEEDVIKRITKEEEETKDATTKNLNLQFLYNERDKILKEKQEVEPKRLKALKSVFIMQEQSKPEGEGTDFGLGMYQDGGQKLSPYAYIMFEGTPEQQSFVQADMPRYFDPNGEFYEANNRQESAEEHLERMRPIYEKMKEADTLKEFVEKNDSFLNKDYNINEQVLDDLANRHGISNVRAKELFAEMKKGGKFKKYQGDDGESTVRLTTGDNPRTFTNPDEQPFTNRKRRIAGTVNDENYNEVMMQLLEEFPLIVQENYEVIQDENGIQDIVPRFGAKESALNLQEGINEYYQSKIDEANKNIKNPTERKRVVAAIKAEMFTGEGYKAKDAIIGDFVASRRRIDFSTLTGEEEPITPTVTEGNDERTSLGLPMLPNMPILPPSGQVSHLKANRRYDRLTPYEVSPEQIIQENQRQAQAAYQSVQGLPDAQRAAAIAQINANTQAANTNAIYQTETQNAGIANQTAAQNAQIQMREEDAATRDALSYEQRQLTAAAITEEQIQQYYDFLRKSNISKFNDVRRMNTINQIMPNYNIDSQGNITVTGTGATQAGISAQARALLAGYAPLQDPTKS